MIKSILFILFFVLIVVGLGVLVYNNSKNSKNVTDYTKKAQNRQKINKIMGVFVGISSVLAVFIPGSFHQVEAGQVAVVKSLGKVVGTRVPGTYFDFYLTNEYVYFDTTVQKLDIQTVSYSSDAQTMDIQMTVQYKIDPAKVENILTEYLTMESLSNRIEKVADDNVKSILSKYSAMKIIETRAAISPEVEQTIKEAVGDRYYVTVTAVNLTNIDFTDEFEKAVEDKVVAEQQKEAAITKAEQELEVAKLIAQAKIEEARGDAESQKIIASASAEAMAIKIVELAKSIGFNVNEKYVVSTETVVVNTVDNQTLSKQTIEETLNVKPSEGVIVTRDEINNTMTTISTSVTNTKYSIIYDSEHTEEDLKIVMDFVQYLEYLSKWDGKLPSVVTGDSGVDIIVPSDPTGGSGL